MTGIRQKTELGARARSVRVGFIAAVILAALVLKTVEPTAVSWLFGTSCGAITGLPCIFCGTTRALHHLLNGEFARAFYFNWIAFPFAALVAALAARAGVELILRRRFRFGLPALHFTPRVAALAGVSLLMLWALQVGLALRWQKHELLNPDGLLYALLVR